MTDEAGLPIDPEMDPFDNSNAPELKHTNLSAQFLVIPFIVYNTKVHTFSTLRMTSDPLCPQTVSI